MAEVRASLAIAINCKPPLQERVAGYVRDSLAKNTRRAYVCDLAHFEAWGGRIPASAEIVAAYLATHAETLSVATLARRVASLSKAHETTGAQNPTRSALVKATLQGIKRSRGTAQHEAKPLLCDELFLALEASRDVGKGARRNDL